MMEQGSFLSPALPRSRLVANSHGKIAKNSLLEDMIKQNSFGELTGRSLIGLNLSELMLADGRLFQLIQGDSN